MIEIIKVETKKQLNAFIQFPFKLYKESPYWVPPLVSDEKFTLDRTKNPSFEFSEAEYWLAYKDGQVVGRIAGLIVHSYIEKWGNKYTRFGYFDFIDDREVSKALIQTVEDWALEKGMTAVHGPLGFNDLEKEGMIVEGYDAMGSFITLYNFPYYVGHLEALGYIKDVDWVEFEVTIPNSEDFRRKIKALSEKAQEKYKIRPIPLKKPKDVLPYVKNVFDLLNVGYDHLYGTVPITPKLVDCIMKQFFSFLNMDYITLLQDEHHDIVGFGIMIPSLSKAARKSKGKLFPFGFINFLKAIRKNDILDMYVVAVKPELKGKGIPFIMMDQLIGPAIKNGMVKAYTGPELEHNLAVQSMWRSFETRQFRRRRCYIRKLVNESQQKLEA